MIHRSFEFCFFLMIHRSFDFFFIDFFDFFLMILIIAVLNWKILGNALRDDSKLFHSLTQKG